MKKYIIRLFIVSFATLSMSCNGNYHFLIDPIPAASIIIDSGNPGPGHIWIEGNWFWNGSGYSWQKGYWSRPLDNYRWKSGSWKKRKDGYYWKSGRWVR